MTIDGRELLGLALALAAEDTDDERVVSELVDGSGCSPRALMGAYAFALSLARDLPYDTSNERTLGLLTRALQRAVRLTGQHHGPDDGTDGLLQHIVDVSGRSAVRPEAVASRVAEIDADVGSLRATTSDQPGAAAG